jgi:hypothetical protein
MQFKNPMGRMMMKNFNINDLLQELEDKKALKLEPFSLGTNKCLMIMSISKDVVQQLSRETSKDRPKKFPTLIGDFNEKFPWGSFNKSSSSDYHYKIFKPEVNPIPRKGSSKDIKNSDFIVLNFAENKISQAQIDEIKASDWQTEGVLAIRDVFLGTHKELLEKWGYKLLGQIEIFKLEKTYTKKNLWVSFNKEKLIIGSKSVELEVPSVLEYETDNELYKNLSKIFSASSPLEIFSKSGKENWNVLEAISS